MEKNQSYEERLGIEIYEMTISGTRIWGAARRGFANDGSDIVGMGDSREEALEDLKRIILERVHKTMGSA